MVVHESDTMIYPLFLPIQAHTRRWSSPAQEGFPFRWPGVERPTPSKSSQGKHQTLEDTPTPPVRHSRLAQMGCSHEKQSKRYGTATIRHPHYYARRERQESCPTEQISPKGKGFTLFNFSGEYSIMHSHRIILRPASLQNERRSIPLEQTISG